MRPSIIFFDEIDGLAPVRSSRQDQIHSSIVSTLLALMDGLDNRGEIVVIGATNRIDSIDPALRRPGRFDREFIFPLPDKQVRMVRVDVKFMYRRRNIYGLTGFSRGRGLNLTSIFTHPNKMSTPLNKVFAHRKSSHFEGSI